MAKKNHLTALRVKLERDYNSESVAECLTGLGRAKNFVEKLKKLELN